MSAVLSGSVELSNKMRYLFFAVVFLSSWIRLRRAIAGLTLG